MTIVASPRDHGGASATPGAASADGLRAARRGRGHAAGARRRPRRLPPAARRRRRCAAGSSSVTPETADAATLVIKPGKDWAGHVPGQYLRVGVDVDGVRLWRTYSLTHGPRPDRCISITVKAIPDGVVSNHLVHRVRPGQMIHLGQAEGDFVLPTPMPRQAAAGHRRLRHHPGDRDAAQPVLAPRRRCGADIVLLHSALVALGGHLRRRAAAATPPRAGSGWSSCTPTATACSTSADLDDARPRPRRAHRPTPAGRSGCSTRSRSTTPTRGLPLHIERFRAGRGRAGEGGTRHASPRTARVVEADGATPILDAAEAAGVLMPSGCRMGICFGCVLPLREGAVRDLRNGDAHHRRARATASLIQTCISAAAGACDIDH